MKRILVLTGMASCRREPYQGIYVMRQVAALRQQPDIVVDFFYPQGKIAQYRGSLKYAGMFLQFCRRYLFSKKRFDIIHLHYFYPTVLIAVVYKWVRRDKVKIICTFHGSDVYLQQDLAWPFRLALKAIDHAIFVSEPFKQRFNHHLDAATNVVCVGADPNYSPDYSVEWKFDLLFVGNLNDNKGSDRLIKLIQALPLHISIAIAGTGEYLKPLQMFENVICLGAVDQPQLLRLYRQGRFLLNLSRLESFGLSMTEAMLCGTPVIATNTDGSATQIINQYNGLVVPNDDAWLTANLADYVLALLALDCQSYGTMCENALSTAQQYDLALVCKKITQIYSAI